MTCPNCKHHTLRLSAGRRFLDCWACWYSVLLEAELESLLSRRPTPPPNDKGGLKWTNLFSICR